MSAGGSEAIETCSREAGGASSGATTRVTIQHARRCILPFVLVGGVVVLTAKPWAPGEDVLGRGLCDISVALNAKR